MGLLQPVQLVEMPPETPHQPGHASTTSELAVWAGAGCGTRMAASATAAGTATRRTSFLTSESISGARRYLRAYVRNIDAAAVGISANTIVCDESPKRRRKNSTSREKSSTSVMNWLQPPPSNSPTMSLYRLKATGS